MIRSIVAGGGDVSGLAEELFEELEPRVVRKLEEAGDILADEIRSLVKREGPPVSGGPPAKVTGELLRSIVREPVRKRGRAGFVVKVGSTLYAQAASLEYGHAVVRVDGLRQGKRNHKKKLVKNRVVLGHVPAYPFMRPAEERATPRIEAKLDEI